jgi:peroxiredoxin family protein
MYARARQLGLPAPTALLEQAKELSPVRVVSCGTELLLAGLTEEAVQPLIDDIVSLPSFWRETAGARVVSL